MSFDRRFSKKIFEITKRSRVLSRLAVLGASELIWVLIGFALGVFWLGAQSVDPDHVPAEWFALAIAIGAPWGITLGMQYIVRRKRPFEEDAVQPLVHLQWKTPSFPSGHATISFALLAFIVLAVPQLIPWFAIGVVAITISRVAVGVHYLSDVIVGSLIGYFGGLAALMAIQILIITTK